jgi:hypothetical protein
VTEPRPVRVRVTGPPRRPGRTRARTHEIDEETVLGTVLMGSLLRAQLRLAVLTLLPLAALALGIPLLFRLAPGLADVRLLGVPLPILVLAGLVYPLLIALGLAFVRRAERHEAEFAELLGSSEQQ